MKRLTMMLLGTVVLGIGGRAGAISLSSRPVGTGPHLFGYFASHNEAVGTQNVQCAGSSPGTACTDLLTDLSSHTNVVQIQGDPTWVQGRLAAVQAAGMGAVVSVYGLFYGGVAKWGDPIVLDPNAATNWAAWVPLLQPYVNSGTIVAFHIGEEPSVKAAAVGQTISVLEQIAKFTKGKVPNVPGFPHVPVWIDLDAQDMDEAGYSAANPSGFTIDANIDWVGYDCYQAKTTTFTNCYGDGPGGLPARSVAYYMGRLKTILRAGGGVDGHGIVAMPDGWLPSGPSASDQSTLLQRVEREASMLENDPSVVMIMPFIWDPNPIAPTGGGPGGAGVKTMSTVRSYYSAWGLHTTRGDWRLACPTSISSNFPSWGTAYGFDYDTNTAWNSQQFYTAAPYITGQYLDPIRLMQLNLYVDQSPAGPATHVIGGGTPPDNVPFTLTQLSGPFSDGQLVTVSYLPHGAVTSQVSIQTTSSPSWVAWRDIQPVTSGSTRVYAYPIAAGSPYSLPEYISDGDPNTAWNSGTVAPASIDLDLGQAQTVSMIQLVVTQSPAGTTEHIIYGGPSPNPTSPLAHPIGWTQDGSKINIAGPFPNVRYLRVSTVNSAGSWVAWREINVFN